ncbi:hypothetical protein, partial [Mycobacterium ulcerans]|uniref:hypothetical protein n=1 Tax=Mycobacterium ulcerans TaxID=1809 RepID=UPI003F717396
TNSNQLDRSPDSPCLHCGPNSAAPKIINPAHKPANQQRRSPDPAPEYIRAELISGANTEKIIAERPSYR